MKKKKTIQFTKRNVATYRRLFVVFPFLFFFVLYRFLNFWNHEIYIPDNRYVRWPQHSLNLCKALVDNCQRSTFQDQQSPLIDLLQNSKKKKENTLEKLKKNSNKTFSWIIKVTCSIDKKNCKKEEKTGKFERIQATVRNKDFLFQLILDQNRTNTFH